MIQNPHLLPKIRSAAMMDAVRGMPCAIRIAGLIPGHRCAGQETVVPCHMPTIGKGIATKVSDLFVAAGCLHCHDLIDRRDNRIEWIIDRYPAMFFMRLLDGMAETQARWVGLGLICGEGWEIV